MPFYIIYQVAMVASLVVSCFAFVLTWRHRQASGAQALMALSIATFVWTASFFIESHSTTLERQLLFNNIGYLGSTTVPLVWFIFSVNYTGGRRVIRGWKIVPLCIIPAVTTVLIWTNNWHHLMWSDEHLTTSGVFTVTAKTYGPFFWVLLVYNYSLIVAGSIALIRRLFVGISLYTGQAIALLAGALLPLIWNVIYVFRLLPIPRKDLTPLMFAISGIAIVVGLLRFRLFTFIPFARKFLFQQLNDGILVFDNNNRLQEANPAAFRLLGTDKRAIGTTVDKIPPLSLFWSRLSSNETTFVELPLEISGKARFFELQALPLNEKQTGFLGWVMILHDITDRKKAADELADSERRLRITADELKDQNDKKTEFLHHVAHELKTPLTAIISSSDLISTEDLSTIPEKQKALLYSNISRSAWMMGVKIDELIELADIQIGHVELRIEPVDLHSAVENLTSQLSSLFKNKQQQLELEFPDNLPPVRGDSKRIQHVLLNLLSNANKFSPTGGRIVVRAGLQGDMIRVEVQDTAPHIEEADRSRLFTPYFRGNSAEVQARLPGLGIGLVVAKSLVNLQGGQMDIASAESQSGNIFFFTLPVWKDQF